jgi:hypothetical protein
MPGISYWSLDVNAFSVLIQPFSIQVSSRMSGFLYQPSFTYFEHSTGLPIQNIEVSANQRPVSFKFAAPRRAHVAEETRARIDGQRARCLYHGPAQDTSVARARVRPRVHHSWNLKAPLRSEKSVTWAAPGPVPFPPLALITAFCISRSSRSACTAACQSSVRSINYV